MFFGELFMNWTESELKVVYGEVKSHTPMDFTMVGGLWLWSYEGVRVCDGEDLQLMVGSMRVVVMKELPEVVGGGPQGE